MKPPDCFCFERFIFLLHFKMLTGKLSVAEYVSRKSTKDSEFFCKIINNKNIQAIVLDMPPKPRSLSVSKQCEDCGSANPVACKSCKWIAINTKCFYVFNLLCVLPFW